VLKRGFFGGINVAEWENINIRNHICIKVRDSPNPEAASRVDPILYSREPS
jgi:hypothetical protein